MSIQLNNSTNITPGAYELSVMGPLPDLQYQVYVSSSGICFKFNKKAVGYPTNACATIAP